MFWSNFGEFSSKGGMWGQLSPFPLVPTPLGRNAFKAEIYLAKIFKMMCKTYRKTLPWTHCMLFQTQMGNWQTTEFWNQLRILKAQKISEQNLHFSLLRFKILAEQINYGSWLQLCQNPLKLIHNEQKCMVLIQCQPWIMIRVMCKTIVVNKGHKMKIGSHSSSSKNLW